ncbi:MAG: type II toxin-antitoxin system RelE/ParE family toxin [Gemmatimonadales bacterium]
MTRASFHPLAERELIDAAQYYELESPGLGASFLDAAERCERAIIEYPHAGAPVYGEIRRRLLQTFPYALLYKVGNRPSLGMQSPADEMVGDRQR